MVKFVLVSLEGNIGAGKSTLFNIIKNQFPDAFFLEEPVDTWQCINNDPSLNILEKFYQDPSRWGLTFQQFAYQSRLMEWERQFQAFEVSVKSDESFYTPTKDDQLTQDGSEIKTSDKIYLVFTERSIESSRTVFFKNLYKYGNISEMEYQIYEQSFTWQMKNYEKYLLDQVIYLKTPSDECHRRLNKRGRFEESGIPLEYLEQLEERHQDWFTDEKNNFEILQIDGIQNFLTDSQTQQNIMGKIRECIEKLKQKFEQIN